MVLASRQFRGAREFESQRNRYCFSLSTNHFFEMSSPCNMIDVGSVGGDVIQNIMLGICTRMGTLPPYCYANTKYISKQTHYQGAVLARYTT
jgi:hypothetical protein